MPARNKGRILVIDDEKTMTEIIASMLTANGSFVETATNTSAVFDLYCDTSPKGNLLISFLTGLAC